MMANLKKDESQLKILNLGQSRMLDHNVPNGPWLRHFPKRFDAYAYRPTINYHMLDKTGYFGTMELLTLKISGCHRTSLAPGAYQDR